MIKSYVRAGILSAALLSVVPTVHATQLLYEPFNIHKANAPVTAGYPNPGYTVGQQYPQNTNLVGLGPAAANYWSFSGDTSALTTPPPDGQVATNTYSDNLVDPALGGLSSGTDVTFGGDGASERIDLSTVSITNGNNEFYSFAIKINNLGNLTTGNNQLGGLNSQTAGNTTGAVTSITSDLFITPDSDGNYQLGIGKSQADTPQYALTELAVGTTYFVVGEYSIKTTPTNGSVASLYLFNSDGSQVNSGITPFGVQPITPDAFSSNTLIADPGSGLKNFAFYQYGSSSKVGLLGDDSVTVDDLRVGTAYANVVPEPASLSLLAIAGVGLIRRRRA